MSFLPLKLSAKAARTNEQPISFLMTAAIENPRLINLAAGLVDPLTLPTESVKQIAQRIFADPAQARAALQYDTTLGLMPLRQATLAHLEKLEGKSAADMGLSPADILITTGSQQALYLVGDCLIDPGDIVIAANPCYFVYTGTLASLGAKVIAVPMDEDGIDVDAVERLMQTLGREGNLHRLKLIYTTSYYQNPTGLSLSPRRRQQLVDLVKRYSSRQRIFILEDAAYRELRYDGPANPSMKPLDPANEFTILTQTFSKPFAPGLKTGYTAMPDDLMKAVLRQKGNHDFGSASLTQYIALDAMTSGLYQKQVDHLCQSYCRKRDAMLTALQANLPRRDDLHWTHPQGGLYVWLTLPQSIDTSRDQALFTDCVKRGVLYVPGDYCFQPDDAGYIPRHHMRLSFGQVDAEKITPAIERLSAAIKSQLDVCAR
jgi:2-aminoadipate transaminase